MKDIAAASLADFNVRSSSCIHRSIATSEARSYRDKYLNIYVKLQSYNSCEYFFSYHPYGMVMDERNYLQIVSEAYRYGFNGKELDKPGMGGGLSTYDYGFRIYNPAIAKFLSVDPLTKDYPWYTPYQFAGNTPICMIDMDGLEEALPNGWSSESGFRVLTSSTMSVEMWQLNAMQHGRGKLVSGPSFGKKQGPDGAMHRVEWWMCDTECKTPYSMDVIWYWRILKIPNRLPSLDAKFDRKVPNLEKPSVIPIPPKPPLNGGLNPPSNTPKPPAESNLSLNCEWDTDDATLPDRAWNQLHIQVGIWTEQYNSDPDNFILEIDLGSWSGKMKDSELLSKYAKSGRTGTLSPFAGRSVKELRMAREASLRNYLESKGIPRDKILIKHKKDATRQTEFRGKIDNR